MGKSEHVAWVATCEAVQGRNAKVISLEQDLARPRPRPAAEIAKLYGLQGQSKNSQEESVAQETGL